MKVCIQWNGDYSRYPGAVKFHAIIWPDPENMYVWVKSPYFETRAEAEAFVANYELDVHESTC